MGIRNSHAVILKGEDNKIYVDPEFYSEDN